MARVHHSNSLHVSQVSSAQIWEQNMAQSLSHVIVHVVWSTKNRADVIPSDCLDEFHGYLGGILRNIDSTVFRIGGTTNHVHVACTLPRALSQSNLVKTLKTSAKWLRQQKGTPDDLRWQDGYGIFSVGRSNLDTLIQYISNQAEHHAKVDFKTELRKLLVAYGVQYDEDLVWT
jgi:REP element-mobilizing transposase RayT